MPRCQAPKISDMVLRAETNSANDNHQPKNSSMKSFEPARFLVQRDHTKQSRIRLILSLGAWSAVFVVAFVVPLLS
jgi:hypothetical protein